MNINYEKKLFNGTISEIGDEQLIPIDGKLYKHADAFTGKVNEFRQMLDQLKDRVYKQATELDERIVNWNSKYSAMEFAIEQTDSMLSDRMFLRADTDGFYKTIFENFSLTNNIDLNASSNINVDTRINSVTLQEKGGSRFLSKDFYRLAASKTPGTFTEPIVVIEGSSLNNLHLDNNSGWTGSVVLKQLKPVSIVIDVSLNYEVEIGEVYLSMVNTSSGASLSVAATYMDNKFEVLQQDSEISNTNVILVNRRCKKIQLVITKNSYDERLASGEYRYIFPLKLLKITKKVDTFEESGVFVSRPYPVFGASKIGIEVCDFTNVNTSIQYFIKIQSVENLNDVNEVKINPINHPPSSTPYAIKLSDYAKANNIKNATPSIQGKDSTSILRISELQSIGTYSFTNDLKFLNHIVTISNDNIPGINFFVNYKVGDIKAEDLYEKTGSYYTTWVYLEKESNRVLNVGKSGIYIEGLPVENSKITLNKTGWFKVKIPVQSYFDTGTDFTSIENLKERDPLYPYNGKYLIEGTNLDVDPYYGFAKQAKQKLDLAMNLDNLNSKSFYLMRSVVGGLPALNAYNVILSKDNSGKNGYIEYNQQNYNLMYDCTLIAKLKTSSSYESPVLSSYKIKLGD